MMFEQSVSGRVQAVGKQVEMIHTGEDSGTPQAYRHSLRVAGMTGDVTGFSRRTVREATWMFTGNSGKTT